ncbi:MAG: chloride channel 7 [Bacillariaceae sp.]|jgi:chloride channel 7
MLFILDDISTFFDQDMFLRILVANSVGTFCLALYRGDLSYYGAIQFGSYDGSEDTNISDRFMEIPWWILLGIIFGILGGGFCKAFGQIKKSTGKKFNTKALKLLRITYISLINSIVMFCLPFSLANWICHDNIDVYGNNNSTITAAAEQQFFCNEGQTNEMATIFFGSRGKAIVRILSNPGQFYPATLLIVGVVFFVLMLYTNTTSIPSGLFTPIVISGAALGGSYGLFLKQYIDENVDPSSFALLGVGAMMASIQRSTVSTCVILVEGTGQMKVLLPVMIVVVVSNYVAYLVHEVSDTSSSSSSSSDCSGFGIM